MANFWEYESKTTQQARDAESWAAKAKQDAAEWLGQQHSMSDGTPEEGVRPLSPGSVLAPDKGWDWTNNDTDSIQRGPDTKPKHSRSGGLLGSIGGFLDDAASTIFMGDVRQPWDLLRPVQRALEAEQKYVARPIAKAALSPLGDYDSLPGIVRAGAETVFDPLTYIGPGAVTDAFKVARLSGGVKLAAPALETLFTGPGSRRVLAHVAEQAGYGLAAVGGGTLFEELGLPGMVGSVAGPAGIQALMGHVPGHTPSGGKDYIAQPDFAEPQTIAAGLKSKFAPIISYSKDDKKVNINDMVSFRRGNTDLKVSYRGGEVYELSTARESAVNAGGSIYDTRAKGSDLKSLLEVRDVLGDLLDSNPTAKFFAAPTDERRSRIYKAVGFKPLSETGINDPVLSYVSNERYGHLILDREAFKKTIPTGSSGPIMSMVGDQPALQKALAGEDRDLAEYFNAPKQAKAKIDSEMSANMALGATPRGREIMAKKTKGDPLNGKDLEDMANLLNDARYPDCAES